MSNKIANLRNRYHISQVELAKIADVSPSAVSKWEKGEIRPKFTNALKIANHFNVPLGDLIDGDFSDADVSSYSDFVRVPENANKIFIESLTNNDAYEKRFSSYGRILSYLVKLNDKQLNAVESLINTFDLEEVK